MVRPMAVGLALLLVPERSSKAGSRATKITILTRRTHSVPQIPCHTAESSLPPSPAGVSFSKFKSASKLKVSGEVSISDARSSLQRSLGPEVRIAISR